MSFKKDNLSRICTLDDPPRFAVESFDRSAVIVSERGFVSSHALDSCTSERSVHVSLIPEGVGVLADVNLNKRLYISLDFVNVQPFLYLAMVASLDSRINMVTLHGATVPGRSLSLQKKYAFGGLASAGSAAISPDGRFVAPTGEPICTDDAYPGVWDIANNRRVITDDVSCAQLFKSK
ncbi:hypothetical protein [Caballeronia sp. M23-90]